MKTSIATVSISGTLVEKLEAIAGAGFDGIEEGLAVLAEEASLVRRTARVGLTAPPVVRHHEQDCSPEGPGPWRYYVSFAIGFPPSCKFFTGEFNRRTYKEQIR